MKETRFFYVPDAEKLTELPAEEANHAIKVLRLKEGDELMLMDGQGSFYRAEVTLVSNHHCMYRIVDRQPQQPQWEGRVHLAIAPTKMSDRIEWLAEKATEMDTAIVLRSYVNSSRIYNSTVAKSVLAREKAGAPFEEVMADVAGKTACKMFFENGDVDGTGIISLGETVGVIDDVPSCKEIIDGMMAECVTALSRFDA